MVNFNIGTRKVGEGFDPLIIAEIGINHGGDVNVAKLMVDEAAKVGVEVIKHQTHVIEDEMSSLAKKIKPGNSNHSIYDIMKSCALSYEEELILKNYVESKNMIFLSTPFSRAAADRLEKMNSSTNSLQHQSCRGHFGNGDRPPPQICHICEGGYPFFENVFSLRHLVKLRCALDN